MCLILLLTIVTLLAPRLGQAAALAHLNGRRHLPFVCTPIPFKTNLSFRDCINAVHLMADDAEDPQDLISFGVGPDVDVLISYDAPLVWEYATCEIQLKYSGSMPQTSSWQRIRTAATLLAHECAMIHKAGWFYFDRLIEDYQDPVINTEGPGLQLWIGPLHSDPDEPVSPPDRPKTCPVGGRKGAQQSSGFSNGRSAFLHAAKLRPGSARTLLNDTAAGCLSVNGTNQSNVTGIDGP